MKLDFTGKRVVVAGASRGIGRAIAVGFAELGAAVSICGRDAEALEATRAAMGQHGKIHAAICDVSDGAAMEGYIADAAGALGGIDVLVNNASAFSRTDDDAGWALAFETDLMAVVRASKAALPWLEQGGTGAIVHISSISARKPTPTAMPYGAIKAAIVQLTASQAFSFAPKGVRVNSVAPGSIEFPGHFYEQRKRDGDPAYQKVLDRILFGRLGRPEEVADVVLFMASPLARWVTGQTLVVDGGQTLIA